MFGHHQLSSQYNINIQRNEVLIKERIKTRLRQVMVQNNIISLSLFYDFDGFNTSLTGASKIAGRPLDQFDRNFLHAELAKRQALPGKVVGGYLAIHRTVHLSLVPKKSE